MMFTREDLNSKKYADLLKILKKLGVKGGRQKTEKVIELILENQERAQLSKHEDSLLQESSSTKSDFCLDYSTENSKSGDLFEKIYETRRNRSNNFRATKNKEYAKAEESVVDSFNGSNLHVSLDSESIKSPVVSKRNEATTFIQSPVNDCTTKLAMSTADSPKKTVRSNRNRLSKVETSKPVKRHVTNSASTVDSNENALESNTNSLSQIETEPVKEHVRRSSTFIIKSNEKMLESHTESLLKAGTSERRSVRRSSTFIVDGPQKGLESNTESLSQTETSEPVKVHVRRSSTFTINRHEEDLESSTKRLSQPETSEPLRKHVRRSSPSTLHYTERDIRSSTKRLSQTETSEPLKKHVRRSSPTDHSTENVSESKAKRLSQTETSESLKKPVRRSSSVRSTENVPGSKTSRFSQSGTPEKVNNKRSATFTIDCPEKILISPKRVSQTGTSETGNGHRRFAASTVNSTEEVLELSPKKLSKAKTSEILDLSCEEVQTAKDIQLLESSAQRNTISLISPVQTRKTMRRSLRGQLLETKAQRIQESLRVSLNANKSGTGPPKKMDEKQVVSPKNKEQPSLSKTHTTDQSEKASAIPRFVSFALKMPNFARIHEKAFRKMEALHEYVERKRTRTKSANETSTPSADDGETTRPSVSKLSSTPAITSKMDKTGLEKSLQKDRALRTPSRNSNVALSRKSSTFGPLKGSVAKLKKDQTAKGSRKSASPKPSALPRLIKENVPPAKTPSNTWNKNQIDANVPGSHQRRKSYIPHTQEMKFNFNASKAEVVQKPVKGRFGNDAKAARREMFKNNAKKLSKTSTRAEMRTAEKVFIKGVRTNRRFELQMANRGIQI